jgi:transposase InsO family protein
MDDAMEVITKCKDY